MKTTTPMDRRQVLQLGAAATATALGAIPASTIGVSAQTRTNAGMTARVAQLVDTSPDQQELSRDYAAGIRLAFSEVRQTSGLAVQLSTFETDSSPNAVRGALRQVNGDTTQLALVGTVGESLALATARTATQERIEMAHVAPWLADPQFDTDARLVGLFASRESQIHYVMKNLASMGVSELGVVYPDARSVALQASTASIIARLQLKTRNLVVPDGQDLMTFASRLTAQVPGFLLFMGGALDLALFTRGLAARGLQRYVICLADVDPANFAQLQPGKSVPVIFTQVVPNPKSGKVPLVRAYRQALQQFLDEAPTPVSLAGYLAGRYVAAVLTAAGPGSHRARVLAEFQRRRAVEIEGWRLDFADGRRASAFVSQSLLSASGAMID